MKMRNLSQLFQAACSRLTLRADLGPIGVGLIGIGGWGGSNAVNIMRSGRFTIRSVHDLCLASAERFSARYNVSCHDRLEAILADEDIRAVSITVPNPFHAKLVRAAADAGKHVFIEKPLVSHPEECLELGHYCANRGVVLQVGHQMRREPVFLKVRRIISNGVFGRPLFAQAVYTLNRRSHDDWRRNAAACPGGSMEQLGVHLIDVLVCLFGPPCEVQGWAENIPHRSEGPDWGFVSISFNRNFRATIATSFSSPRYFRLEVFFEKGQLATDGRRLWLKAADKKKTVMNPKGISGSVAQFIEFANCIEHGRKPETGYAEAATVMRVVHAMMNGRKFQPI